jgi:hypothetical protein
MFANVQNLLPPGCWLLTTRKKVLRNCFDALEEGIATDGRERRELHAHCRVFSTKLLDSLPQCDALPQSPVRVLRHRQLVPHLKSSEIKKFIALALFLSYAIRLSSNRSICSARHHCANACKNAPSVAVERTNSTTVLTTLSAVFCALSVALCLRCNNATSSFRRGSLANLLLILQHQAHTFVHITHAHRRL